MDVQQLRCFVTLAEELHFGRAAARLNMTQPPFSRQIQLLEKEVGGMLFSRDNRHVKLTYMGEHLLKGARQIVQQTDQLSSSAHSYAKGESGVLSIGFTAVLSWAFIPSLLKKLTTTSPDLTIHLYENVSHKQIEAIENHSIDVGFVRSVPLNPNLNFVPLNSETMLGAFHSSHPLARKRKITLDAFEGEPFLQYSPEDGRYFFERISDLFAFNNIKPDYKYELAQTHIILGLVNAGLGCAIVPSSAKTLGFPNVTFINIDDVNIQANNFMVFSKHNTNPALPLFISHINNWTKNVEKF